MLAEYRIVVSPIPFQEISTKDLTVIKRTKPFRSETPLCLEDALRLQQFWEYERGHWCYIEKCELDWQTGRNEKESIRNG